MNSLKTGWIFLLAMMTIMSICGPVSSSNQSLSPDISPSQFSDYQQDSTSLTCNTSAWHFDAENNVYWQIGVVYCSSPEASDYEKLAIYIPGEYVTGVENGDGTYTCTLNEIATVNGYTAKTAPILFPVNTPGYSAQKPATSYNYNQIANYMDAGFIYVEPGMRGRNNGYNSNGTLLYSGGAPWGVTDLKAAVRFYRFNEDVLPGDTDRMFTAGMSGGGAQSAVMGASGDSSLYYPYLESIGAAIVDTNGAYISDAIFGAMCWCPITSLDYADEAYEWNMGQFSSTGSRDNNTWTSALSKDLAGAFASYINKMELTDTNGTVLTLKDSGTGISMSGTYYEYILSTIEGSLNNFLQDTTFPYTETSGGFMGNGGFGGGALNGMPPGGNPPDGNMPGNGGPGGDIMNSADSSSTTYETAQDYIDSLNSDEEWVFYDVDTNTVSITSIEAFVRHCKNASKNVPAFDDLNRTQAENYVFGTDENDALHFDETVADLLQEKEGTYSGYSDWNSSFITAYQTDLTVVDALGNGIDYRQNMYNPMYYLWNYYDGYKSSTPAKYWRIRTGIDQGDTALTVETNLALVLDEYEGVKDVDFETVWGQGHTTAERSGTSTDNYIEWVNECMGQI